MSFLCSLYMGLYSGGSWSMNIWGQDIKSLLFITEHIFLGTSGLLTLNHFEIAYKFSSTVSDRFLFMYSICLVPAMKLYSSLLV
jgi:hypothetical protein